MRKYNCVISNTYKQGFGDSNLKHVSLSLVCIIILTRQDDHAVDSLVTCNLILEIFGKHFRLGKYTVAMPKHTHTHTHTQTRSCMHACIYGGYKAHSPNMNFKVGPAGV